MTDLLARLGMTLPIVQAPMAGVSTPALAAAVSDAGGLGSLGLGASDARGGRAMIDALRSRTDRSFNVNLFVHDAPRIDAACEAAWLQALRPEFARFAAVPPAALTTPYRSFADDDAMLAMLIAAAPPVVSFHFGLPTRDRIAALRGAGCILLATATNPAEARAAAAAGIDAIVAQGYEAGGHRGVFDPAAPDPQLGTMALVPLIVAEVACPVIAAGGIMNGGGIRAALSLGAAAAQLGTAFVACPESGADKPYRRALTGPGAHRTVMTAAISGRPARGLGNTFTGWGEETALSPPDYPRAYAAGKALAAAAGAEGDPGYGAHWAGQGAPLVRAMPAAALMRCLADELADRG